MVKGLQHMTSKEKPREPSEEKAKGDLLTVFIFLMEGCREDKACFSWRHAAKGQRPTITICNEGISD